MRRLYWLIILHFDIVSFTEVLGWVKFFKIFVTQGKIWRLWMILPSLRKWWIPLDCEMLSSPDTLSATHQICYIATINACAK